MNDKKIGVRKGTDFFLRGKLPWVFFFNSRKVRKVRKVFSCSRVYGKMVLLFTSEKILGGKNNGH